MKQFTRKQFLVLSSASMLSTTIGACANEPTSTPVASTLPPALADSKVRLVVTGHSPSGKAVVASDTEVAAYTNALAPGMEFYRLWGADEALTFPDDGSRRMQASYFPPVGGFRFGLFTIPPASVKAPENVDLQAAIIDFEKNLPGLAQHMEQANPGMHTSDTVDFEYVISGEVVLELDDGVKVRLGPGDTVIQNGTRHAWRNPGTEPCVMVVCLIGANRKRRKQA
jgi:mannose-6-phosphate isomerase-like protein (cupin superfamily)